MFCLDLFLGLSSEIGIKAQPTRVDKAHRSSDVYDIGKVPPSKDWVGPAFSTQDGTLAFVRVL